MILKIHDLRSKREDNWRWIGENVEFDSTFCFVFLPDSKTMAPKRRHKTFFFIFDLDLDSLL